jgi:hypothetical protein
VSVTDSKTAQDWARQVKRLADHPRYGQAERITCDHLNTHHLASLYQTFEPSEALRIAMRLELVHTPRHGSWLNVAESELSVLTRQCLDRRIGEQQTVAAEVEAWGQQRNAPQIGVDWQFTTDGARIKLKHPYPNIKMC